MYVEKLLNFNFVECKIKLVLFFFIYSTQVKYKLYGRLLYIVLVILARKFFFRSIHTIKIFILYTAT